jgi:hypothetical protein
LLAKEDAVMTETLDVADLTSWLSGLPAANAYVELDAEHCLLAEYARRRLACRALARRDVLFCRYNRPGREYSLQIPEHVVSAIAGWPRTHGALLARLRRAPAAARSPAELARA